MLLSPQIIIKKPLDKNINGENLGLLKYPVLEVTCVDLSVLWAACMLPYKINIRPLNRPYNKLEPGRQDLDGTVKFSSTGILVKHL